MTISWMLKKIQANMGISCIIPSAPSPINPGHDPAPMGTDLSEQEGKEGKISKRIKKNPKIKGIRKGSQRTIGWRQEKTL